MGVLMELGIGNPVPPLNALTASGQLQQAIWGCAEAGEKKVVGIEMLAVACSRGDDFNDPACADPLLTELWRLFRSQRPGDVTTMTDLVILDGKRDLVYPRELTLDLAMQGSLVGLDRQQEVGALLLELLKNGSWACRASAWITRPWRFNSPSGLLRTARSCFSLVAQQAWLIATPSSDA
jgi:hypothetical protein